MTSPTALLLSLLVVAGAAADVSPTLNTADIGPVSAAGLPFLDYEDPPPLDAVEDEEDLEPTITGGEVPAHESEEPVEGEAGLENDDLPEAQSVAAAGTVLDIDSAPQKPEQTDTTDDQASDVQVSQERSRDPEDDYGDEPEFEHHDAAAELPTEPLQTLHAVRGTPDVQEPVSTRPAAGGAAAAADDAGSSGALASPPVSFSVKQGGSLVLPCGPSPAAVSAGDAVSWHHAGRLLVGGGRRVSSEDRLELSEDGSLRLLSADTQDEGTFTCRVHSADGTFTDSRHHVHVLTHASEGGTGAGPALRVVTEPADGVTVVRRGQPATLICWAPGEPTATVTWTKQGGTLPYGESVHRGPRLEIGQVDRTHRGTYLCTVTTTDNRTALRSLQLQVNFAPEVTALETVVHSGEDQQAVLRCRVFAHPPAEVHWMRPTGLPLRPGHHLATHEGDMFSLTMLVETADLDTYICTASNVYGSAESSIVLTGRPGQPTVTSPTRSSEPWSYTLSWRTLSVSPLLAHKLLYRRHTPGAGRPSGVWRTAWREAVIPLGGADDTDDADEADEAEDVHRQQYVIRSLEPSSEYEAHVLAQNRHGWSKPSAVFRFQTRQLTEEEYSLHGKHNPNIAESVRGNSAPPARSGVAALLFSITINLMIRL